MSAELSLADLTDAQRHELGAKAKEESIESQPLISNPFGIEDLAREYQNGDQSFVRKIRWLQHRADFKGFFKARGDGDCFYRAFAFAFMLRIINMNDRPLHHFVSKHIETTQELLERAGFEKDVVADFWEPFKELLSRIHTTDPEKVELTAHELIVAMNNPEISNSVVVYLRLVTSAFLKVNKEEFTPFLFAYEGDAAGAGGNPPTMEDFCANQIEAIGKEADHLAITALSRALLTSLEVVYLSRSPSSSAGASSAAAGLAVPGAPPAAEQAQDESDSCDIVRFDMPTEPGAAIGTADASVEKSSTQIALLDIGSLLFRPGHYDVLIKAPKLQNTPSPVIPKAPVPKQAK